MNFLKSRHWFDPQIRFGNTLVNSGWHSFYRSCQALEQTSFYAQSFIPSPSHAVPRCLFVAAYMGSGWDIMASTKSDCWVCHPPSSLRSPSSSFPEREASPPFSPGMNLVHMPSNFEMEMKPSGATHGHQRPGPVCDEWPRRKLRCNIR